MKEAKRAMMKAPSDYKGTLGDLFENWAQHVLLDPSAVEHFHKALCGYLKSCNPLFLVRNVGEDKRRETIRTRGGHRLRLTDNAPAWWIHHQLFLGHLTKRHVFTEFIENIPCHMFDAQKRAPDNVNKAGWHVAHIFDTKCGGGIEWDEWDADEVARRFVRNIHPCNYFYIPKGHNREWQQYGDDLAAIAFFYNEFQSRYRSIWDEFLHLVGGGRHYPLFYGPELGSSANQGRCSPPPKPPALPIGEIAPPLAVGPPLLVRNCAWSNRHGWKPFQRPADLDQLEAAPGSRIEFHLNRNGTARFILAMTSDQWKTALGRYYYGKWRKNGYAVSLTRSLNGRPIEEFVPRWARHIRPADAGGNPTISGR